MELGLAPNSELPGCPNRSKSLSLITGGLSLCSSHRLSVWPLWFHCYGAALFLNLECWQDPAEGLDHTLKCLMVRLEAQRCFHLVEKHKELRPGVFGWALGVLPRAHWSFVARAEWELVYVHDVSGMKALGTADQEDVFRDAGFHGDRTTWAGSQTAGRSVNISESFASWSREGRTGFVPEEKGLCR